MDTFEEHQARYLPMDKQGREQHLRALQLRRIYVSAMAMADDPEEMLPNTLPENWPDFEARVDEAEERLHQHLLEHRDLLGEHPEWQSTYDIIDTPGPSEPELIEPPSADLPRMIGQLYDDPPF